jgi:hypothetical protein
MDNQTGMERRPAGSPLSETPAFLIAIGACVICAAYWLLLTKVYHFTGRQAAELASYALSAIVISVTVVALHLTRRSRREQLRVQPPLVMGAARDQKMVDKAWAENAVVLGYDIHGDPWLWPDRVRVMQGIVLGMTGSGKHNIVEEHHHPGSDAPGWTTGRPAQNPIGLCRRLLSCHRPRHPRPCKA